MDDECADGEEDELSDQLFVSDVTYRNEDNEVVRSP